jgi:RNA polymerase sigma-70 factor (ECF subfamily)
MTTTDARQLVNEILAGNTVAFERIIKCYERLVSHIVFRIVTNEADQQDVCQEVFIKVFHNLPKFQFESKLSTWIGKIAYNTCINYLKKKKVPLFDDYVGSDQSMDNYLTETVCPDDFAEARDLNARLQVEISKLPVQFRTILTLYHLDEMSYAEIAEITQLPDGTVKSYLFRARKQLKERLVAKYQLEELCL